MSAKPLALRLLVCSLLVISVAPVQAQRRGGEQRRSGPGTGNPEERPVHWTYMAKGAAFANQPLVLYWLPASLDDIEKSPLSTSLKLFEDSSSCLGLQIVAPDDAATIERLGATGKLPIAMLTDGQGRVIRTAENVRGVLRPAPVEQMVTEEFRARDEAMYREMTEARRLATSGDKQRAIELYKKVWDDRCLFPVGGAEARRALGVRPVFKRIDSCAAEFAAATPYMYSTSESGAPGAKIAASPRAKSKEKGRTGTM